MSNPFEHECTTDFEVHGKRVHVHLGTLQQTDQELGGVTIRDSKGRVLVCGIHDGFGERDPRKIAVIVDLAEAFTQKLPKRTLYHHAAELFKALEPLIAALPKSKWEKADRRYKSPARKLAEQLERAARKRRIFEGRYVPLETPPGGWRQSYEYHTHFLPKGHAALGEIWRLWRKHDPQDQDAWIAAANSRLPPVDPFFEEFRRAMHDIMDQYHRWGSHTSDAESVLGLTGNYDVDAINRAWRIKSKVAHPDVGGSAEQFRRITEARNTLLRICRTH